MAQTRCGRLPCALWTAPAGSRPAPGSCCRSMSPACPIPPIPPIPPCFWPVMCGPMSRSVSPPCIPSLSGSTIGWWTKSVPVVPVGPNSVESSAINWRGQLWGRNCKRLPTGSSYPGCSVRMPWRPIGATIPTVIRGLLTSLPRPPTASATACSRRCCCISRVTVSRLLRDRCPYRRGFLPRRSSQRRRH